MEILFRLTIELELNEYPIHKSRLGVIQLLDGDRSRYNQEDKGVH
ncbi:hypothetical protein [Cyclobacterium amurskyense]|nr:hypothetical protein [Cyclobacterium amurskyense]